ncbi:MAG: hypothetical protein EOM37_11345 [Proteobacteria bacterium]|nr:hypothetical protein [Pseudomonadota bacterium]
MKQFNKIIDWKEAANWLLQWEGGLGGISFDNIYVKSDVSAYADDILAMCWVSYENPVKNEIEYLLSLSSENIEYIYSANSSVRSDKSLEMISELYLGLKNLSLDHVNLEDAAKKIGLDHLPELKEFINKICEFDDFKSDKNKIINTNNLINFLAKQPPGFLTKEIMEICANDFPSPDTAREINLMIASWINSESKPCARVGNFAMLGISEEIMFLWWLFARLQEFTIIRDDLNLLELKEILQQISTVNIRSFGPGMGGAHGHAIYNQLRTKWDSFVKICIHQ